MVVGGVDTSGIYAPYSQGLAAELTVSAVGEVLCADHEGGASEWEGTSFGEPLSMQISLTSDLYDIGNEDSAAPAVAGLAAYLMSLDQYREQIQVQGSVARNVRDLIKSLAYARRALQPAVVWNGIDSLQIHCPVRRDAGSSGCPARNTTLPVVPPATHGSKPLPSSTATGTSTTTVTSSSKPIPSESSIATDSSTTSIESFTSTLTISPGGTTEIVTIPVGGDSVVATVASPRA